jgi:hypothetical protein
MGVRSKGGQASGPVARKTSRLAHRRSSWMAPFRRGRSLGTGGEFAGGEFREPVQVPVACTRTGDDLGDIIGMFGLGALDDGVRSPFVPDLLQTLRVPPWTRRWRWLRASAWSIQGSSVVACPGRKLRTMALWTSSGSPPMCRSSSACTSSIINHLACQPEYRRALCFVVSAAGDRYQGADCSAPPLREAARGQSLEQRSDEEEPDPIGGSGREPRWSDDRRERRNLCPGGERSRRLALSDRPRSRRTRSRPPGPVGRRGRPAPVQ